MIFTTSIKHPKEFSLSTGATQLAREIESINQSLKLILTTAKGEQFGDPNFGSRIHEYIFDYSGETLFTLLKADIAQCLNEFESRVLVREDDIVVVEEGTTVKIKVGYLIKYSNLEAESTILVSREEDPWII